MDMNDYANRCKLAATRQGLDPVAAAVDEAGMAWEILNGGGYCMCLVVRVDGGHVIVTGWDTEPGTVMVGGYVGTGWEDGAEPTAFAENVAVDAVLSTVEAFAAQIAPPVTLSPAAVRALSILLDVNDDDETMIDAGVPADGLADLRTAAAR